MLSGFVEYNAQQYNDLRFNLLLNLEESRDPKELPYADSVGIPTIGVGFNIKIKDVRNVILNQLGIDPLTKNLSEQKYISRIISIVDKKWTNNTSGLKSALDKVMKDRAEDSSVLALNKRTTFRLEASPTNEIRNVFDNLIEQYGANITVEK